MQLARGHRIGSTAGIVLDLGAISEHLLTRVQMRPQLNYKAIIRSRPTRMRWSATVSEKNELTVKLHINDDVLRTVEVIAPVSQLSLVEQFCEDLALHDWLITVLDDVIEQTDRDAVAGTDPMKIFGPVAERLVNLWMPGAHINPALRPLWETLEERPGFSRQWKAQVATIRDRIALRTLEALEHMKQLDANW
ncbi:MAG TPA: SCO2521 family protein, partial [Pseudonocardiaceae bacterium]|nr:SCO2521 family protein [Pseudonocardiaceae bacterium]